MKKLVEYSEVRIRALMDLSIDRDGWRLNKRPPAVGDTGILLDILQLEGHPDRYVVENSDMSDGTTIWLSEFTADELEPLVADG
jgi:hypothetical protein